MSHGGGGRAGATAGAWAVALLELLAFAMARCALRETIQNRTGLGKHFRNGRGGGTLSTDRRRHRAANGKQGSDGGQSYSAVVKDPFAQLRIFKFSSDSSSPALRALLAPLLLATAATSVHGVWCEYPSTDLILAVFSLLQRLPSFLSFPALTRTQL